MAAASSLYPDGLHTSRVRWTTHGTKLCSTEPVRIPILLILVVSSGVAKIAEAL
jgi:hypothetical protein